MNILLAAIILVAGPARAQQCARVIDCPETFLGSPSVPSAADWAGLQVVFAAVAKARADESRANTKMQEADKELQRKLRISLKESYPLLPSMLRERLMADKFNEVAASDKDHLAAVEALRTAQNANYRAHNEAIIETMKAYQLTPVVSDFRGDSRAAFPNMVAVPWSPRYSRRERLDNGKWRQRSPEEIEAEKLENSTYGGGAKLARTTGNGVMQFFDNAFDSPETLALSIFHETSHWIDVAAKSSGHVNSDLAAVTFRTEQRAYENAARMALKIGANPASHLRLAAQFKAQADIAEPLHMTRAQAKLQKNWIGTDWDGALSVAAPGGELDPADEDELSRRMEEAQSWVREQREKQEVLMTPIPLHPETGGRLIPIEPERIVGKEIVMPSTVERVRGTAVPPDEWAMQRMMMIASKVCGNSSAPIDSDLNAVDWSAARNIHDIRPYAANMSDCELRIFQRLSDFAISWYPGARITSEEVRGTVTGPVQFNGGGTPHKSPSHEPVWGKTGIRKPSSQ